MHKIENNQESILECLKYTIQLTRVLAKFESQSYLIVAVETDRK